MDGKYSTQYVSCTMSVKDGVLKLPLRKIFQFIQSICVVFLKERERGHKGKRNAK